MPHYGSEYLEPLLTAGVLQQFNTHSVNGDYKVDDILTNFTKFLEWDSPMISDTDRETGRKFMRRVKNVSLNLEITILLAGCTIQRTTTTTSIGGNRSPI